MVISDNPKYIDMLKVIATNVSNNKLECLISGRECIINEWIDIFKQGTNSFGEKSIQILTKDINSILDKILGCEFE